MGSSKSASKSNVIDIPREGRGAPRVDFNGNDGPRIRINVYHDDGSRDTYELNFTEFDTHESMSTEQFAFVIRKEIIASGQIDLSNWTLIQQYTPQQSGLTATGVKF